MKPEYVVVAICFIIITIFVAFAYSHKLKAEYWISCLALIVSIAFGSISWITSYKANRLQIDVYNLTKQAKDFEIRKGEILLMSLLGRYFVIMVNCWEQPSGKMRTDEISTKQYIHELKQLDQDVNNLVTNPFYIEVLEKYPEINLLWFNLRRVIIKIEKDHKMAVDLELFNKFYDLYFKIKNDIPDKKIFENKFYTTVDDIANYMNNKLPKSR